MNRTLFIFYSRLIHSIYINTINLDTYQWKRMSTMLHHLILCSWRALLFASNELSNFSLSRYLECVELLLKHGSRVDVEARMCWPHSHSPNCEERGKQCEGKKVLWLRYTRKILIIRIIWDWTSFWYLNFCVFWRINMWHRNITK